jgi:methylated-DNA-[protein]-cysteine S-methyltransferase
MKRSSLCYDVFDSPLGPLYLIFSGGALAGVSFAKPAGIAFRRGSAPAKFMKELAAYFQGLDTGFSQKIRFLSGTDFEKKIWLLLRDIPYGETRTYKWVAERVGNPLATRAVGRALSKNPIPIVLPCHRVVESKGSIGGYSSGVDIKKRLLDLEYYSRMNRE